MKNLLLFFLLLLPAISAAQHIQKEEIQGKILVPEGMDAEGILIYNKTSGLGTISTQKGDFRLKISVGDSIIFSALQFKELIVVADKEMIDSGQMNVEIKEGLNELAEIVLRSHELTGDLEKDVGNIEVVHVNLPEWSAAELMAMDMAFPSDNQSSVRNAAMGETGASGVNLLYIADKLINLIAPKSAKPKIVEFKGRNKYQKIQLEKDLRERYDETFFRKNFQISSENISDFISFSDAKGLHPDLLTKEKEMDLLQLLILRSAEYRELLGN